MKKGDGRLGPRDLASRTGVSTDTLRYYERRGLLPKPERTGSGYRRYSPEAVRSVMLIRRALVVGFSVADLARVLAERDRGGAPCRWVRDFVERRLGDLDEQIGDLQALRADLTDLLEDWGARLATTRRGRRAHLLDRLADRAGIERARVRRSRRLRG
jgi:DNA-binding transcriptional MerR regulator